MSRLAAVLVGLALFVAAGPRTAARPPQAAVLVTPADIPSLSVRTRVALATRGHRRGDWDEDKLRFETQPIFCPLELTQRHLDRLGQAAADGGAVEELVFRGVAPIGGRRYAVIEGAGRTIPWWVTEGERLEGTKYVVTSLDDLGSSVTLEAPTERNARWRHRVLRRRPGPTE